MTYNLIQAGLDDLIFPIFIVIAIIVRIVTFVAKQKQKGDPDNEMQRSSPPPGKSKSVAEEDLRDFLERLSGVKKTTSTTVTAPPLPPPTPLRTATPQNHNKPILTKLKKVVAAPLTLKQIAEKQLKARPLAAVSEAMKSRAPSTGIDVKSLLQTREALKKAILLREILGPPIALRESAKRA